MAQRRHHYERAFEAFLRSRRVPYVVVDEARKSLLPPAGELRSLKSFDFVIYGSNTNLLVDVKGRKCKSRAPKPGATGHLESWVTEEDVRSLGKWEELFGEGFEAMFVFMYWCADQPPDGLFQEVFVDHDRWYALRAVRLRDYREHMVLRSPKWRTVGLPAAAFQRVSQPFCPSPSGDMGVGESDAPALQPW